MIFNQDQDQQINIVNSLAAAAEEMAAAADAEDPADILEATPAADQEGPAAAAGNIEVSASDQIEAAAGEQGTKAAAALSQFEIDQYIEAAPSDEKGRKVVPDEFFNSYFKQFPNNVLNESKSYISYNGGKLRMLGNNPEADQEIHYKGGKALQAKIEQRRTMAEDLLIMLAKVDKASGLTEQQKGLAAMMEQMQAGNVKAGEFVRNTVGEQPVNRQEVSAEIMTAADKELIKNALERLQKMETGRKNDQKLE